MPLESLIEHIDDLVDEVNILVSDLEHIPYSNIKQTLRLSGQNYINGLKIAKETLEECIIRRAELLVTIPRRDGRKFTTEDIIRSYWLRQVSGCYSTIERFNSEIAMQAKANIPSELYYWICDFLDKFEINSIVVLQQSNQFANQSFEEIIIDPLSPLIDIGKQPLIPGSLIQTESPNIVGKHQLKKGYVISYISGEANNPLFWPTFIHEALHVVDREKDLIGQMKTHYSIKGEDLPVLHKDEVVNSHWITEIFADVMAVHCFGPMYAYSLLNYFERAPYVQTIEHPEMSVRLYSVHQYLEKARSVYTDILHRCVNSCKAKIAERIEDYKRSGELSEEKQQKVIDLYGKISNWLPTLQLIPFVQVLMDYLVKAEKSRSEMSKKGRFVAFPDLLFTYDEIVGLLFEDRISLALNPNMLCNIILANIDRYDREKHFEVIVDSIKKWKIKQVWELRFKELEAGS